MIPRRSPPWQVFATTLTEWVQETVDDCEESKEHDKENARPHLLKVLLPG